MKWTFLQIDVELTKNFTQTREHIRARTHWLALNNVFIKNLSTEFIKVQLSVYC